MRLSFWIILPAILLAVPASATTGLPIPRFVSLKSAEVNVRTGPGERYPIKWIYQRDEYPVEITNEFEHWRKIRDRSGKKGWIHKSLLSGKRTVVITGSPEQVLYRDADKDSSPIFRAQQGVVGELVECEGTWCRVQVSGMKGWLPRSHVWGVYDHEGKS